MQESKQSARVNSRHGHLQHLIGTQQVGHLMGIRQEPHFGRADEVQQN